MKKIISLISALLISLSTLLITTSSIAHAANGCPTGAGYDTWSGAGNGFWSDPSDWVGDVAPVNGDNLVFDNTSASGTPSNDITNLTVGSITLCGTGNSGFHVNGNDIDLSSGINDNTIQGLNSYILLNMSLVSDQTFSVNNSSLNPTATNPTLLTLATYQHISLGNHNLTFSSNSPAGTAWIITNDHFSGTGNIIVSGVRNYILENGAPTDNSSYNGSIEVRSGALTGIPSGSNANQAFGGGTITVDDGASLYLAVFGSSTLTIPNNINLAGSGASSYFTPYGVNDTPGVIGVCGFNGTNCNNVSVTLSGHITLTGDPELGAPAAIYTNIVPKGSPRTITYTLSGQFTSNCFPLTAVPGSDVTLVNNLTDTSYAKCHPTAKTNIKTPNTGFIIITKSKDSTYLIAATSALLISLAGIYKRKAKA